MPVYGINKIIVFLLSVGCVAHSVEALVCNFDKVPCVGLSPSWEFILYYLCYKL